MRSENAPRLSEHRVNAADDYTERIRTLTRDLVNAALNQVERDLGARSERVTLEEARGVVTSLAMGCAVLARELSLAAGGDSTVGDILDRHPAIFGAPSEQ